MLGALREGCRGGLDGRREAGCCEGSWDSGLSDQLSWLARDSPGFSPEAPCPRKPAVLGKLGQLVVCKNLPLPHP